MAKVELINVVKRFGDVEVVHGINLTVEDHEFMVLVGPSGCGKSTVLRMVAGLETISSGEIVIGNRAVTQVSPKDRNVAMVFQNYALYPHMTVRDNMGFSLKMKKIPRDETDRKVVEAARTLELEPFLDRKPAELSGGQRQRVAMGRAIVRQPEVFLFDEPLSNLDAQLRTQMRMELRKLHLRLQTTTIYVTHDQIEAMTLADRIVILKDGKIQQVGSPIEVFEKPENVFVAKFIGNPPMNIFPGNLGAPGGEPAVVAGDFKVALPEGKGNGLAQGDSVLIGIRPDAIKIGHAADRMPEAWRNEARVIISEVLGSRSHLELEIGGNTVIAEVEGRVRTAPGQSLTVGIDLDRLALFDPASTNALP